MAWSQTLEAYDLLDSARVTGEHVASALRAQGVDCSVTTVAEKDGSTDFIRAFFPGFRGKYSGGMARTLGIIGRLGGIGARPQRTGLVSDADGAITAVAVALKLAAMRREGDLLAGDVMVATHICARALIRPTPTVAMMESPVDMKTMNAHEVDRVMDAIISVDTTRGNRIINHKGIAISLPVKEGYVLRAHDSLLDIYQWVTGRPPVIVPLATQDITPYGTGLRHINSILQPSTATTAPVVGLALTAEVMVPGAATGASQAGDIEMAVRFCLEVAKAYGEGTCEFYSHEEFRELVARFGSMAHLQTTGHPLPA